MSCSCVPVSRLGFLSLVWGVIVSHLGYSRLYFRLYFRLQLVNFFFATRNCDFGRKIASSCKYVIVHLSICWFKKLFQFLWKAICPLYYELLKVSAVWFIFVLFFHFLSRRPLSNGYKIFYLRICYFFSHRYFCCAGLSSVVDLDWSLNKRAPWSLIVS